MTQRWYQRNKWRNESKNSITGRYATKYNLFAHTRYAYKKALEWSKRREEFVKRAGFTPMARLAVSDKKREDKDFEVFLKVILEESMDDRIYVKKAVNWTPRQIGKKP